MPLSFTTKAIRALEFEGLHAEAFGTDEVYGRADDFELVVRQEANGFSVFVPGVWRYNESWHPSWRATLKDIRFRIGPPLGDDEFPGDPD